MTELESLSLLIADLNAQVRSLQQENAELRAQVVPKSGPAPMPTWGTGGPTGETTA